MTTLAAVPAAIWAIALATTSHAATTGSITTRTITAIKPGQPTPGQTIHAPRQRAPVLHYQWLRCRRRCRNIRGANRAAYRIQNADTGHQLRVRIVTLANTIATSDPTGTVGRPAPINTAIPTIADDCASGSAGCLPDPTAPGATTTVGDNLTGTNGTWRHAIAYTYRWLDCDATGTACQPIPGATTASYTIQDTDVGSAIVFEVTAYNYQP